MKRVLLMFVTVLLMVFSVMGINVNAEIEESMPFDGNDFSGVEKVNENAVTDAESEESSQLQIVLRDNTHDRTGTNFVVNGKQVGDVTGLSWDEQSRILTMNNAELADFTLDIIVQQFADYDSGITIQLIGNNEVCQVVADPETTLAGDGTLNAGQFIATHFTMTSGVLNLESTRLAPLYAGFGMPYPTDRATGYALFNDNYGSVEEPNLYRFLGGSVSISGDYLAGIDVQSGNVEIANTDIKINIPKYGRFGLAVGWAKGNEYWGGDLKIENARVEIISDEYMTYFYHLEDSNNNLNYYVGSGKSQEKVTFDEAFVLQDTGSIKRYSRNTHNFPGENYLLITNENLFADVVDHEKFYFDAVYWALDNEITVGAGGPGKFSPSASCTREQFVTFLWRMEGKPEPEEGCTFSDVPESAW
ncbi:MAG: S-layer homology domain-containing protein, partial [Erysipelotrichaceae bacterium]|nr:S-layer homology domain-containing protein [Erysipelotrichaceae bacterium]